MRQASLAGRGLRWGTAPGSLTGEEDPNQNPVEIVETHQKLAGVENKRGPSASSENKKIGNQSVMMRLSA